MTPCSVLDELRSDIEKLKKPSCLPLESQYFFGPDSYLELSIQTLANDEILLQVNGPLGRQEANLDDFEKLINIAVLYISRQVSACLEKADCEPSGIDPHSGADEILALFKARKAFQEKSELPFIFNWKHNDEDYELFTITVANERFKITLQTNHIHGKTVKHVTDVKEYPQIMEKTQQFIVFELIAWLTPKKLKYKNKSAVFAKLSMWIVPSIVSCLLTAGILTGVWFSMNQSQSWRACYKEGIELIKKNKISEGVEKCHKSLLLAEQQKAPDVERLNIQIGLTNQLRDKTDHDLYLKESAKLIMLAQMQKNDQLAEQTMFRVAQDEFARGDYNATTTELQSLISLMKRTRGKEFAGLVKCYVLLGQSFFNLNKLDQAETALKQAITIAEKSDATNYRGTIGICHYQLGLVYREKKDYKQALKYFKMASDLEDNLLENNRSFSISDKRFLKLEPKTEIENTKKLMN